MQKYNVKMCYYNYYYYYWKRSVGKAVREQLTPYISVLIPDPHMPQPTERKKRKGQTVEDNKGTSRSSQLKRIDLALEPSSSTPSNTARVSQIVPHWYWDCNKSPALLRSSAVKRLISSAKHVQPRITLTSWNIRHR